MKKVVTVQLCLAILLVAVLSTVAVAENRANAFTVSPMFGTQLFDDGEGFEDSEFYGLNLGYNVTKNWSAELVGTYANGDLSAPDSGDFNYWTGRVDALYHFLPEETFVPYIVGGLGVASVSIDNFGASNEDFIFNYGVGFKYFFIERLALRLDARQTWRLETGEHFRSDRKNYSNFIFSGGLTFLIGQ